MTQYDQWMLDQLQAIDQELYRRNEATRDCSHLISNISTLEQRLAQIIADRDRLFNILYRAIHGRCTWHQDAFMCEAEQLVEDVQKRLK